MSVNERALLLAIYHHQAPYGAVKMLGNEKQNLYYLEKWTNKGWYEYGVNILHGWLTKEGKAVAEQLEGDRIEQA